MQFDELFEHRIDYEPPAEADESPGVDATSGEASGAKLPAGGGIYLLTDADDQLVLLSAAGDIKRALRTRLLEPLSDEMRAQNPAVKRRARLGEIVRRIRWRPAHSMFEIDLVYLQLARQIQPHDYVKKLGFGPAWFVHVDPDAHLPRLVVTKRLTDGGGLTLGPFATQSDASRFVQILEDGFDLCREYAILEQVPNGQPCAYFEMGKCPAPCDGSIPLSQYREMVRDAIAFGLGRREEKIQGVKLAMQKASDELAFEHAAALKQQLDRLMGIEHAAFRHVRDMKAFNYLVVQRGRGRSRVKPFHVRQRCIEAGDETPLTKLREAVPRWVKHLTRHPDPATGNVDPVYQTEQSWLVSHYLFKRDPPGLFFHVDRVPDPDTLIRVILERFNPRFQEQSAPQPPSGECEPDHSRGHPRDA